MSSPTQRSLKMLRDDGWTAEVVEKWNPHVRQRKDLFGFADVIAMKPGEVPRLIQVTSGSNTAARIAKIREEPMAATALQSGFAIEVHGWRKLKVKRGGKAERWTPKIEQITDLPCQTEQSTMSQTSQE